MQVVDDNKWSIVSSVAYTFIRAYQEHQMELRRAGEEGNLEAVTYLD